MSVSLLPSIIPEFLIQGVPASGGLLYTYAAGTTTKLATYTDSTGSTPQTNPIVLNARGEPQNTLGNSVGLWLTNSTAYKFVLSPSTDTDPPTNAIWTIDNIPAGQLTGTSYTASGTNAIALTPTNNTPTPVAYANYNTYVFAAPATSTGPVTIQVGSLGYLNAYINGVQATTGQIQSGEVVIAVYNSALNSGAGGFALYLSVNPQQLLYGADTGSANAYVVNPTNVLSALTTGQIITFIATNANTTASTLNVSGLGAKAIVNQAGAALIANQILAGSTCICVYNGTSWVMSNTGSTGYLNAPTVTNGLTVDSFAGAGLATNAQAKASSGSVVLTPSSIAGNVTTGANGSIALPGGYIEKWTAISGTINTNSSYTWPVAFPTAVDNVQISFTAASVFSPSLNYIITINSASTNASTVAWLWQTSNGGTNGSGSSTTIYIRALGH